MRKTLNRLTFGAVFVGLAIMLTGASCSYSANTNNTASSGNHDLGITPAVNISMSSIKFSPASVTASAGSVIRWTNNDAFNHTVTADANSWLTEGLNSDNDMSSGISLGSFWDWQVPAGTASGTKIYYHCRIHGAAGNGSSLGTGMAAVITVQ